MSDGENRKLMANIPPFGLRMQPDLKATLEAAARQNNRSLNAEIVLRLEDSFQARDIMGEQAKAVLKLTQALDSALSELKKRDKEQNQVLSDARRSMDRMNEIAARWFESPKDE